MVKKLATIALVLGAFLVGLAALSKFYMYDRLAVAPYNASSTSISETLEDAEYLNVGELEVESGPLRSTRVVEGDVETSKDVSEDLDRDVAVYRTYSCTDVPDFDCGEGETPLSGTVDLVAFDRHTGEAVEWDGSSSESSGETQSPAGFEGLYFKFPFDTQKTDYEFWDGTIDEATRAEYTGEDEVDGLPVYTFEQVIEPTKTGEIEVPGDLVGSDEDSVTADRIYSNVRTFSVEPTTGVIVIGGEDQDSYLELDGERVLTTTAATLQYTDDNTQATVEEYSGRATLLGLVQTWVPIIGLIAGIVLIAVGAFLHLGDRGGQRKAENTAS